MKAFHWNTTHSAAGRARRRGVLLATFFTVAAALALSAATTAGAAGSFGPHANVGSSSSGAPSSTSHVSPSTTVAPLSQANIVVTDLSANASNVFEYTNPAPIYPTNENCNTGPDGSASA